MLDIASWIWLLFRFWLEPPVVLSEWESRTAREA
jgi:hypothetical protein